MISDLPGRLGERLGRPLPGETAQYRMAPFHRKAGQIQALDLSTYRQSAVLILLCKEANSDWFIPLTLRTEYKGAHSAQVSLPGGKYEEQDGSLQRTALRECCEEIGISENVRVLGPLSQIHIPVSNYLVQPFVALLDDTTIRFISHEREVKEIIRLPLSKLLDENTVESGSVQVGELEIKAPYFFIAQHKVWGATAMILSELKILLRDIGF